MNQLVYFWLCWVFCCCAKASSSCAESGLLSSCRARASHCGGFSCCRAQVLECASFSRVRRAKLPHSTWNLPRPGNLCPLLWQGNEGSNPGWPLDYQGCLGSRFDYKVSARGNFWSEGTVCILTIMVVTPCYNLSKLME